MKIILDRIVQRQDGKRVAVFETDDDMINISEDNASCEFFNILSNGIIIDAEIADGKVVSYTVFNEETEKAKERINEKLNKIFGRNKK